MRHISEVINLSAVREDKSEQSHLDPVVSQIVDKVFVKMALICRGFDAFYSDRNRLNAEKTQWILAFSKNGLRIKEKIEPALKRLETYKFPNPPQLGEFIAWCTPKPEDIGLPDIPTAYSISIAMNTQFSTFKPECQKTYSVLRHVLDQIGSFAYRSMTADQAFKAFESYYKIACNQFMEGKLQEIPKAIPENPVDNPDDRERSNAARLKAMEAIRNMGIAVQIRE